MATRAPVFSRIFDTFFGQNDDALVKTTDTVSNQHSVLYYLR